MAPNALQSFVDEQRRLLLNPPDAAQMLAISQRLLWSKTSPRGPIPCVKIGRSVRYAIADLTQFVERQNQPVE